MEYTPLKKGTNITRKGTLETTSKAGFTTSTVTFHQQIHLTFFRMGQINFKILRIFSSVTEKHHIINKRHGFRAHSNITLLLLHSFGLQKENLQTTWT